MGNGLVILSASEYYCKYLCKVRISLSQCKDVGIIAVGLFHDGLWYAQGELVEATVVEFTLHPLGIVCFAPLHAPTELDGCQTGAPGHGKVFLGKEVESPRKELMDDIVIGGAVVITVVLAEQVTRREDYGIVGTGGDEPTGDGTEVSLLMGVLE